MTLAEWRSVSTPETPALRSEPLARQLTALGVWLLVINGIIGAGIFGLPADAARLALLFAVSACLTAITVVGTRNAMSSLGVLTLLKFLPLVALIAYGLLRLPDSMRQSVLATPPADMNLGAVVLVVFYAFVGFESGLVPAGEARDPRRDMPRALFWAIGVVAILYFGLQTVSLAVLPDLASTRRPLVEVSGTLFGPVGALLMMTGMAASVGGNLAGPCSPHRALPMPWRWTAACLRGSQPCRRVSARQPSPSWSLGRPLSCWPQAAPSCGWRA